MSEPVKYDSNKISLIVNKRNGGKTTYVLGDKKLGVPGLIDLHLRREMRVLVVLTLPHNSYNHIPEIPLENIHLWTTVSVAKVIIPAERINDFHLICDRLNVFWNIFIIYEDAVKHTEEYVCDGIKNIMIDANPRNVNMLFMYHSWMEIPKALYKKTNYIQCGKVPEHPYCRKKEMSWFYDKVVSVWEEVMKDKNEYASKLIVVQE